MMSECGLCGDEKRNEQKIQIKPHECDGQVSVTGSACETNY